MVGLDARESQIGTGSPIDEAPVGPMIRENRDNGIPDNNEFDSGE